MAKMRTEARRCGWAAPYLQHGVSPWRAAPRNDSSNLLAAGEDDVAATRFAVVGFAFFFDGTARD